MILQKFVGHDIHREQILLESWNLGNVVEHKVFNVARADSCFTPIFHSSRPSWSIQGARKIYNLLIWKLVIHRMGCYNIGQVIREFSTGPMNVPHPSDTKATHFCMQRLPKSSLMTWKALAPKVPKTTCPRTLVDPFATNCASALTT